MLIKKNKIEEKKYVWNYFPKHKTGYLKLTDKPIFVENTLVLVEGHIMLDRDKKGNILGIEIIL